MWDFHGNLILKAVPTAVQTSIPRQQRLVINANWLRSKADCSVFLQECNYNVPWALL